MIAALVLAGFFFVGVAGQADGTKAGEIYRVGGDVLAPQLNRRVEPKYSEVARRERIEGVVILEGVVTTSGSVTDIKVLKALHPLVDEAAIEAVQQWHYSPAVKNGTPVACYLTVTCKFALNSPPPKPRPPKSLVGNWQVPGKRVWIEIGKNNRAYQCQITTADIVSKAHGVVSETPEGETLRWENDWPTDLVRREGDDLLLTNSARTLLLRPLDAPMAAGCSSK
jgi:TonB family protein